MRVTGKPTEAPPFSHFRRGFVFSAQCGPNGPRLRKGGSACAAGWETGKTRYGAYSRLLGSTQLRIWAQTVTCLRAVLRWLRHPASACSAGELRPPLPGANERRGGVLKVVGSPARPLIGGEP